MPETALGAVKILAYFGLVLGVIGAVAPVVPGPPLIWLSALIWAWADGSNHVGWPTLVLMGVLALVAESVDIALSTWFARRTGASWRSLFVAGLAAVIGLIVWSLPGALIGAGVGVIASEMLRTRGDLRTTLHSSSGLAIGYVAGIAAQLLLVLAMLLLFTLQAFGPV